MATQTPSATGSDPDLSSLNTATGNDEQGVLQDINPRIQPSFSLQNRLARVLWGICYLLLFRPSPRPLHGWRSFLLRCFGAQIGRHCHVYPSVEIWAPWHLELGDYVGIGDQVSCYTMAKISCGEGVVISQGSYLCTGSHDYESPNFQLFTQPIRIERQVWICAQAFICPGVTVAEGAVVGARSVVTKDVPAWMVCGGHPCKPLKPRAIRQE